MNIDDSIRFDTEVIEEKDSVVEVETGITISTETSYLIRFFTSNLAAKTSNLSVEWKRYCKFKKEWKKIPEYTSFLQACQTLFLEEKLVYLMAVPHLKRVLHPICIPL